MNEGRTTSVPYSHWPLRARVIEKLYRWTHGGQIRTLVYNPRRDPCSICGHDYLTGPHPRKKVAS